MRGKLLASVPRYPEIESVGRAIVITNSERSVAACPLRHWFRYSLGLDSASEKVTAASFGTGFHSVMEAAFTDVMQRGSESAPADSVFTDALMSVAAEWSSLVGESYGPEDLATDTTRLIGVVEAWRQGFDWTGFLREFEVVAVERAFTTPIVHPTSGAVLRASMRVVEDRDSDGPLLRLAKPGEAGGRKVQWKWLFTGRVDVVLRNRISGSLWLMDHKTTAAPTGLASKLSTDPQSVSYAWLVGRALGAPVAGFLWNIVDSTGPSEVRILKSGKLSLAARQKVPSWRVEKWLQDRLDAEGVEPTEAELEFVAEQRATVDPRWAMLDSLGFRQSDVEIAGVEIYADAIRLARLYRDGVIDDRSALAATHPRVPVCKAAGAFCSFRGPCSSDGDLARSGYEFRPARTWRPASSRSGSGSTTHSDSAVAVSNPLTNGDLGW